VESRTTATAAHVVIYTYSKINKIRFRNHSWAVECSAVTAGITGSLSVCSNGYKIRHDMSTKLNKSVL